MAWLIAAGTNAPPARGRAGRADAVRLVITPPRAIVAQLATRAATPGRPAGCTRRPGCGCGIVEVHRCPQEPRPCARRRHRARAPGRRGCSSGRGSRWPWQRTGRHDATATDHAPRARLIEEERIPMPLNGLASPPSHTRQEGSITRPLPERWTVQSDLVRRAQRGGRERSPPVPAVDRLVAVAYRILRDAARRGRHQQALTTAWRSCQRSGTPSGSTRGPIASW